MVRKKNWVLVLGMLLVAACNVSDDPPVVNKNNQNNQNNPNNVSNNNGSNNGLNNTNTNPNNTNQNNPNNTNQNNTNQNNTNQNNSNNNTNVPTDPLPPSAAVTGGAASMQSGNYSLKVSVGAPAANPKPKATQNQIEVAPVVPR